jgi:hypothetical protein
LMAESSRRARLGGNPSLGSTRVIIRLRRRDRGVSLVIY